MYFSPRPSRRYENNPWLSSVAERLLDGVGILRGGEGTAVSAVHCGRSDRSELGGSAGAAVALEVFVRAEAEFGAAALISPVTQLAPIVARNERAYDVVYPWTDHSRAVAERLDCVRRADEIDADEQPRCRGNSWASAPSSSRFPEWDTRSRRPPASNRRRRTRTHSAWTPPTSSAS
jgi:hypothetical protein